jgi:hypothetical protein
MIAVVDVVAGECPLCRPQLLTPIVRESAHWRIAINRNQNLLGKLFVALRRHEESVAELTPERVGGAATRAAVGRPAGR